MKDRQNDNKAKKDTSAKGIIQRLMACSVLLFHTSEGEPIARFYVGDHWQGARIKSPQFREWLSSMCYHREGFVPSQAILAEVINTLAGKAVFDSPQKGAYVRVAESDGAIYIDLGNDSWEAIKITGEGWNLVPHAPVTFLRAPGALALPPPIRGGNVDDLRSFLNLRDEDHWKLLVSWLIGSLRPGLPFPILVLEGSHGSAKSTAARFIRALLDPNTSPLRASPKNERDLAISAGNAWCLAFDNLSSVSPWLSDALCRLSTGGGFSTRANYTDDGEKLFNALRPILLNGIALGIEREDLLDRAIVLSFSIITEDTRLTEKEIWQRFEAARPLILGSLFDTVACALRRYPEVDQSKLPRMGDFATFICAAEPALGWSEGSFLAAYRRNIEETNASALEASPLVPAIKRIAAGGPWKGAPSELYDRLLSERLSDMVEFSGQYGQYPNSVKALSQALQRLIPNLQRLGIIVETGRTAGDNSKRFISLRMADVPAWRGSTN
jgi:hypothetical protein